MWWGPWAHGGRVEAGGPAWAGTAEPSSLLIFSGARVGGRARVRLVSVRGPRFFGVQCRDPAPIELEKKSPES